jgi:hypothetical protein
VIEVDAQAIWCKEHLARFLSRPGNKFPLGCQLLFDKAVRVKEVMIATGWNPLTGARGDPEKLTAVLAAKSPLCCFVHPNEFERVVQAGTDREFVMEQSRVMTIEHILDLNNA